MTGSILLFGATGAAGKYIIQSMIDEKASFSRVGIFTSQNTVDNKGGEIQKLKDSGVEVHVGDVTKEHDVLEAYKDYDTIVSAVGRNAILTQIDLLRWAEQTQHIKRFFPSEYGTDIEYFPYSIDEKPHQLKLKVRAYIKEHIKRLDYTYVVTGPYSEMWLSKSPPDRSWGGWDVQGKNAVLVEPDASVSFTTMVDLGRLVVKALQHPDSTRNKALKVNSFTATPNEILTEFENQTGGEKWEARDVSIDQLKKEETAAWEKGDPTATVFTLRRIWAEGGTLYEKRDNADIDAEDMEPLSTAVKRAIETQTGGSKM